MLGQKRKLMLMALVTCALALFCFSCSKKESSDSGVGDAPPVAVQILEQPQIVNEILQTVSTSIGIPTISGLPLSPSQNSSMALTFSGSGWTHYMVAFQGSGEECSTATYSEWVLISQAFSQSIGADGPKRICFIFGGGDEEAPKLNYHEYYWLKDTQNPSVTINALSGFGPNIFEGTSVDLSGSATDNSNLWSSIAISISESGTNCLNSSKSAFDAGCPNYISASGTATWSFTASESVFTNGLEYTITARATDAAGNANSANSAYTWDSAGPTAVTGFTVTSQAEEIDLSWDSNPDAAYFLVVHKKDEEVSYIPTAGTTYVNGEFLGGDHVVAYFGTSASATDTNLLPNTVYHYEIFPLDLSKNIGSGVKGNGVSSEMPRFSGITEARPAGFGRNIIVKWDAFHDGVDPHNAINYEVYTSSTSGGQDFSAAPDASVLGDDRLIFEAPGSNDDLYIVVKDRYDDLSKGANSREIKVTLTTGYMYKLTGMQRFDGVDPDYSYLYQPRAAAYDSWNNLIFTPAIGSVSVYCQENTNGPYCKNRAIGAVYHISGLEGSTNDGDDDVLAFNSPFGDVRGLTVDPYGNIFLADRTHYRIRAICNDTDETGFCFGRTKGNVYYVAGTGVAGDGINDANALYQRMGNPLDVALDNGGNIYIADEDYERVRLICWNLSSTICSDKKEGYIYWIAGSGAAADGADDLAAMSSTFGTVSSIDVDSNGNIYLGDTTYRRIRALCYDVSASSGFCNGKTSGNMYRLIGTGSNGDAGDNTAAVSEPIGLPLGLKVDGNSNVWFVDSEQFKIRTLCYDVASAGYCLSKTSGNVYHFAFDGVSADGGDDSNAKTATSAGALQDIALDTLGNVTAVDLTYYRLRSVCQDTSSGGFCDSQTEGNHYRLAGLYTTKDGQTSVDAYGVRSGEIAAAAVDSLGNIYYADTVKDQVRVLCLDTSGSVGPCVGNKLGFTYIVAGSGTTGNAASDLPATDSLAHLSNPYGLALDSNDNLFISDYNNRRVRVVCYDNSAGTNFCDGQTVGNMYDVAGTTSNADGADDLPALTAPIGTPYGIAIDSYDNIFIGDPTRRRVRAICVDIASPGFCNGKHDPSSDGNYHHYRFAGTGANADGDTGAATAVATGQVSAVAIDHLNNVYFSDYQYERVRVVCQTIGSGGFCDSKTQYDVYRFAGTGVAADGADDVAATSGEIYNVYALAIDGGGNLYMSGATYERIRLVCNDNTYGNCNGKTVGNVYNLYGDGNAGNGYTANPGSSVRQGGSASSGLAIQSDGTLIYADATYDLLRVFLP